MITQGMRAVDKAPVLSGSGSEKHTVADLTTSFQTYMAKGNTGKLRNDGQADTVGTNIHTDSSHKDMYEKESITSSNRVAQNHQVKKSESTSDSTAAELPDEETLNAVKDEIRQVLKDVLDMDDEELDAVLASMNLNLLSLLQPENLQMFLTEATGTEPIELLTNSSLTDVLNQLNQNMQQILDEHDLDTMDWQLPQDAGNERLPMSTMEPAEVSMEQKLPQDETPDVIAADTGIPVAKPGDEQPEEAGAQIWDTGFETKEETSGIQVQVETEQTGNRPANQNRNQQPDVALQNVAGNIVEQMTQAMNGVEDAQGSFYSDVQQAEIVKQVIEQIRVSFGSDTSQLEVQLYPQHLGRIQIQVMMKNGVMTAQIHAETEMAKQAIEGQLQQLKDTFQQKSIQVEAVEVSVSTSSFQQEQQRQDTTGDSKQSHRSRRIRMNGFDMPEEDLTEEEAEELLETHGASVEFTA